MYEKVSPVHKVVLGRLRGIGIGGNSPNTIVIAFGWRCRFVRALLWLEFLASVGQRAVVINPLDPRSGEPSFDRSSALTIGALEMVEGPAILVTHSMANALAGACKEHVQGIVLAAPPAFPLPQRLLNEVALATLVSSKPPWLTEPLRRHLAASWRKAGFGSYTTEEVGLELAAAATLMPRLEARFRPHELGVPVLSTLHESDDVFPVTDVARAELISSPTGAQRRIVRLDCRHVPTGATEAAAFGSALAEFATDVASGNLLGRDVMRNAALIVAGGILVGAGVALWRRQVKRRAAAAQHPDPWEDDGRLMG